MMASDKGHIWRCILFAFLLKKNIAEAAGTIRCAREYANRTTRKN